MRTAMRAMAVLSFLIVIGWVSCPVRAEEPPSIGRDEYQPDETAAANIDIAIANLKELLRRFGDISRDFKTFRRVEIHFLGESSKAAPSFKTDPATLTLTLSEIIKSVEKNKKGKNIRIVPGLHDGKPPVLREGDGNKTEADAKTHDAGVSPHAYTCVNGTRIRNVAGQWEKCPEGNILIDEKVIGPKVDLKTCAGYIRKIEFTSILAHEKAHEYFLTEGDKLGVPRDKTISEAAHLVVYDFQKAIVDEEEKLLNKLFKNYKKDCDDEMKKLNAVLDARSGGTD